MPGLRRVSGEETIGALERLGFVRVRQRGSQVVLRRQTGEREVGCVVPLHRELAVGTLHGILRQAKVTPDEFMENLQPLPPAPSVKTAASQRVRLGCGSAKPLPSVQVRPSPVVRNVQYVGQRLPLPVVVGGGSCYVSAGNRAGDSATLAVAA